MPDGKHQPTSPRHREAYLRHLARELIETARTWGYTVNVRSHIASGATGPHIELKERHAGR